MSFIGCATISSHVTRRSCYSAVNRGAGQAVQEALLLNFGCHYLRNSSPHPSFGLSILSSLHSPSFFISLSLLLSSHPSVSLCRLWDLWSCSLPCQGHRERERETCIFCLADHKMTCSSVFISQRSPLSLGQRTRMQRLSVCVCNIVLSLWGLVCGLWTASGERSVSSTCFCLEVKLKSKLGFTYRSRSFYSRFLSGCHL